MIPVHILAGSCFFRSSVGHRPKWFWNDRKKIGQNVWKYRL